MSRMSWKNCQPVTSTMVMRRSTLPMVQVWRLDILVMLLFLHLLAICILKMCSMFHKPKRILFQYIVLQRTILLFLEFHPNFFLIKDRATRSTLLKGRCCKGLYPLPPSSSSPIKQAFGAVKPSFERWHSRLGHPASPIVTRVINENKLPLSSESTDQKVCDTCQRAKSHQLPYAKSSSVSSYPLEKNIMSVLLMITVNSLGFIFLNLNMRFTKSSSSFKLLLSACLIEK